MYVGRSISRGGGALGDHSKIFPGGGRSGEICFFPLKTKKTTFFLLKISKSRMAKAPLPNVTKPEVSVRISRNARQSPIIMDLQH